MMRMIRRLSATWGAHFLNAELMLAVLLAAVFVYWSERAGGYSKVNSVLLTNRGAVYGALASVFGSLLGFTITAFSILLGLASSPQLEVVREQPEYPILWRVYKSSVSVFAAATAVALVSLVLDRDTSTNKWTTYLMVFYSTLAAARIYRVMWVLSRVTDIVTAPPKQRSGTQSPTVVP